MKPILFNTEMVKAILDGRKTVTRRPLKHQPIKGGEEIFVKPSYQIGDVLIPAVEIVGYDVKYCADFNGNIWSRSSGEWKLLKSSISSGYKRLSLRKGGKDVSKTVHKIICATYYGEKPFLFPPSFFSICLY